MPANAIRIQNTIDTWIDVVAPPPVSMGRFQPKIAASGSPAMVSGGIGMYVMFVTLEVRTDDAPRMMNSVARVTMNDGRPVRTTMRPFNTPRNVVTISARMIESQTGSPQIVTQIPITIPAKPTIEPIDRSNSPA